MLCAELAKEKKTPKTDALRVESFTTSVRAALLKFIAPYSNEHLAKN